MPTAAAFVRIRKFNFDFALKLPFSVVNSPLGLALFFGCVPGTLLNHWQWNIISIIFLQIFVNALYYLVYILYTHIYANLFLIDKKLLKLWLLY